MRRIFPFWKTSVQIRPISIQHSFASCLVDLHETKSCGLARMGVVEFPSVHATMQPKCACDLFQAISTARAHIIGVADKILECSSSCYRVPLHLFRSRDREDRFCAWSFCAVVFCGSQSTLEFDTDVQICEFQKVRSITVAELFWRICFCAIRCAYQNTRSA